MPSCRHADWINLQVIILLCLSVLFLVYLRVVRPLGERPALASALGAGLLELGTYICGIILLAKPHASTGFVYASCFDLFEGFRVMNLGCRLCPAVCA